MEKLLKTISMIEKLFSKNVTMLQGRSLAKDLVVRASPQNPPHVLPILCATLQQRFNVYTATHVHSSIVKGVPNALQDFLPTQNCEIRMKADICITLIWKEGKN